MIELIKLQMRSNFKAIFRKWRHGILCLLSLDHCSFEFECRVDFPGKSIPSILWAIHSRKMPFLHPFAFSSQPFSNSTFGHFSSCTNSWDALYLWQSLTKNGHYSSVSATKINWCVEHRVPQSFDQIQTGFMGESNTSFPLNGPKPGKGIPQICHR